MVVGAVFGPAESLQRDELVEKAAIEVIFKARDGSDAKDPNIQRIKVSLRAMG